MKARQYQLQAISEVLPQQVNMCVMPQRSGKSAVMKFTIDRFQPKHVLIICGYRKIIEQLASYYPESHTFILSGKQYDATKQVQIASYQTLANRTIDLSIYDLILVDEYHSRTSQAVHDVILQPNTTIVLYTGTPLTNGNKLLSKHIDNWIQPVTVKQLLDMGYITPTKFFGNSNLIADNASELKTNRMDFTEEAVDRIMNKSQTLQHIVDLIDSKQLNTNHHTLVYLNYISTVNKLVELLGDRPNIFVVHSKLSDKQQKQAIADYTAAPGGLLISVRSISLGFDSPISDTIIFGLLTKIHSLALQILWRASTLNPTNPNKVAHVYDMTGQLATVNPFTDFSEYKKSKPCSDECEQITNPMERYFCLESCKQPILVNCGTPSMAYTESDIASNFTIIAGTLCEEKHQLWDVNYTSTEQSDGSIIKQASYPCGCITQFTVINTLAPINMIELYTEESNLPSVTILYSKSAGRAIGILDQPGKHLKAAEFTDSEKMYAGCLKYFKQQSFHIVSNVRMPKLPNVTVKPELNALVPLIDWDNISASSIVKQIIKAKLESIVEALGMKKGVVYYKIALVTKHNERECLEFVSQNTISRRDFFKFFEKYSD